jgi:hypothetical protein
MSSKQMSPPETVKATTSNLIGAEELAKQINDK